MSFNILTICLIALSEKLATKMLKKDEQFQKLKEKKIDTNFLKLF